MRFNLLCICVHQVAGIKGMLIANKRQDNQVKTYMTYNKGRDWRLLQAPAANLDGNEIHCILVSTAHLFQKHAGSGVFVSSVALQFSLHYRWAPAVAMFWYIVTNKPI